MWFLVGLFACGEAPPTYYEDAKPIIDARCATCHQPGDVGPFPMTTAEEVAAVAAISEMAIESGQMPPFLPSHDCNDYASDFDLTPDERDLLLAFFADGAPAGDPERAVPSEIPSSELDADLVVPLPEAYTPVLEPDDYRCQLIDLGLTESTFVTGLEVRPDQRAIVHHTIVFVASEEQRATYEAYDAAEEGPGWTCFGGPRGGDGSFEFAPGNLPDPERLSSAFRTLGSWVPGTQQGLFPAGTGIRLNPGDSLVVQMHYNTLSADPVADRSEIAMKLASEVEYEATSMPLLDLAWPTGLPLLGDPLDIPAGSPDASAEVVLDRSSLIFRGAYAQLGVDENAPLRIHGVNVHMHELGVDGRIDLLASDGEECLLHYPDYDFDWQGQHFLSQPIVLGPDDRLRLRCQWDNTAANQPVFDGVAQEPRDVTWGEGTTDEMCLGALYVTR